MLQYQLETFGLCSLCSQSLRQDWQHLIKIKSTMKNDNPSTPKFIKLKYVNGRAICDCDDDDFDEEAIGVEAGVFEIVFQLNKLGIYTTGSCEGHFDRGISGPWVDIESETNLDKLEKQLNQLEDIKAKLSKQPGEIDTEQYSKINKKYWRLLAKIRNIHLPNQAKLLSLLADFYQNRRVPFDVQLHLTEIFWYGGCRLESQGVNIQAIRPLPERKRKLKQYQAEMIAFGEYLKTRRQAAKNNHEKKQS
jgi:hypothetical protein